MINSSLQKSGVSYAQGTERPFSNSSLVKAQLERQCWRMVTEHSIAIWAYQATKSEDVSLETTSLATQTKITTSIDNAAREVHQKFFNTGYELARTPTMPFGHFEVLVKCQCENGVHLIKGKEESHACKEIFTTLQRK